MATKKSKDAPVPAEKKFVKNKYTAIDEIQSRNVKHLMDTGRIGEAVEVVCRYLPETLEMLISDMRLIVDNPRCSDDDKRMIVSALERLQNRAAMFHTLLSGEETPEQRIARVIEEMREGSDKDSLKELLGKVKLTPAHRGSN